MPHFDSTLAPARSRSAWKSSGAMRTSMPSVLATAATDVVSAGAFIGSPSFRELDPRIDHRVEHVHDEIHQNHGESAEEHEVLHDRVVAPFDGVYEIASQPRNVEDGLDDDE